MPTISGITAHDRRNAHLLNASGAGGLRLHSAFVPAWPQQQGEKPPNYRRSVKQKPISWEKSSQHSYRATLRRATFDINRGFREIPSSCIHKPFPVFCKSSRAPWGFRAPSHIADSLLGKLWHSAAPKKAKRRTHKLISHSGCGTDAWHCSHLARI